MVDGWWGAGDASSGPSKGPRLGLDWCIVYAQWVRVIERRNGLSNSGRIRIRNYYWIRIINYYL